MCRANKCMGHIKYSGQTLKASWFQGTFSCMDPSIHISCLETERSKSTRSAIILVVQTDGPTDVVIIWLTKVLC